MLNFLKNLKKKLEIRNFFLNEISVLYFYSQNFRIIYTLSKVDIKIYDSELWTVFRNCTFGDFRKTAIRRGEVDCD